MRTTRAGLVVGVALCAAMLVGCSSDDGGDPLATLTDPPTTAATIPPPAPSTSVVEPTTAPPSTPAPTEPTTTMPAPTTTVADVQAQIQADLSAGRQRLRELQMHPSLDGLEERMATIALAGSEYFQQQVDYVNELVSVGDVVTIGDPPVDSITVESVTFEGPEPYAAASVKVCDAQNVGRVTPAENSPVGEVIVFIDPELISFRYSIHVVRTEVGWLRDTVSPTNVDAGYPGEATCG